MQTENKTHKIFIFGSCVTRDVFRVANDGGFLIADYIARQSIISSISEGRGLQDEDIGLASAFQRRLVLCDFNKTLQSLLEERQDDSWLMLDFIDERFPVIKKDGSFFTKSDEFNTSELKNRMEPFEVVPLEERRELFREALPRFFKYISRYLDAGRCILHKTGWADRWLGKDGLLHEFASTRITTGNEDLNYYQETFVEYFHEKLKIIEAPDRLGYEGHQWGNGPFHFTDEYYFSVFNQLNKIVNPESTNFSEKNTKH